MILARRLKNNAMAFYFKQKKFSTVLLWSEWLYITPHSPKSTVEKKKIRIGDIVSLCCPGASLLRAQVVFLSQPLKWLGLQACTLAFYAEILVATVMLVGSG